MLNTPNSGQRRAALRVKQKRRNDQKQWTTDGKLLHRKSSSRPSSRLNHQKPWNERFIFDDEPENDNTNTRGFDSRSKRSQEATHGKENIANQSSQDIQTRTIRHYTERADGEIMLEFTRCEILPSDDKMKAVPLSPVIATDGKCHDLIGTRSIGVSPFDLTKVKAALDAHEEEETHSCVKPDESEQATLHVPSSRYNPNINNTVKENNRRSLPHSGAQTLPLDENKVEEFLEAFEDLLYTMELEEELLRRDLARNQTSQQIPRISNKEDSEIKIDREEDYIDDTEPRISIPKERAETIVEYIQASRHVRAQQEQQVTKKGYLTYGEIVEM